MVRSISAHILTCPRKASTANAGHPLVFTRLPDLHAESHRWRCPATCPEEHLLTLRRAPGTVHTDDDAAVNRIFHKTLVSPISVAEHHGHPLHLSSGSALVHDALAEVAPVAVFRDHRCVVSTSGTDLDTLAYWSALHWAASCPGQPITFAATTPGEAEHHANATAELIAQHGPGTGLGVSLTGRTTRRLDLSTGTYIRFAAPHESVPADTSVAISLQRLPDLESDLGEQWLTWWLHHLGASLRFGAPMLAFFHAGLAHFVDELGTLAHWPA